MLFASACQSKQPTETLTVSTPSVAATSTQVRPVTSIPMPIETQLPTDTPIPSQTPAPAESTPTAVPTIGRIIVVSSTADSGPGSIRQALLDANSGDTITFDPTIFLPKNPVSIILIKGLPPIHQGQIIIDASNAGVILDGSQAGGEWTPGLEIASDFNVIHGLLVVGFTGPGILINPDARFNNIGGDRSIGLGLLGQGNLFSDTSDGVAIMGSDNQIVGNLIGTDITGTGNMGNRAPGVFLEGGASRNIIGPDNIIAYNGIDGGGGVEIRSENAQENVITGNSIHDNAFAGIFYNIVDSASAPPLSPVILGFDIASGFVEGISCSQCIVEIFSTSSKDGEIFEGQVIADENGNFSYSKDTYISGPFLTATATDSHSNTSQFSAPTSGPNKHITFQDSNDLPITLFQPKNSQELEDNRIGIMLSPELEGRVWMDADYFLHKANVMGVKRVRLSIDYFDLEEVDWEKGTYSKHSIDHNHDRLIDGLIDLGIIARHCLNFWDPESPGKVYDEGYFRFKNEDEIQRYLEYVRFVVNHFKGKIDYYEILNEPSPHPGTQRSIEVEDYINIVRRVIPIIREEDPLAGIVVGAIPNLYEPWGYEYMLSILNSDVMPLVDGISFHPMHGVSPDYELKEDYYNYPSVVQEIKETASAHDFEGQYFADELVWRTVENPLRSEPWTYSEIGAAKYYARAIVTQLGLDLITGTTQPGFNDLFSPERVIGKVIQNLSTIMAGVESSTFSVGIYGENSDIRSYGFSLSSGEKLLALWTDGIAIDEDPGIPLTLTFPRFVKYSVIGIDVLNGIEQELNTSTENGNLVIHDLLVKDYPLILRLSE